MSESRAALRVRIWAQTGRHAGTTPLYHPAGCQRPWFLPPSATEGESLLLSCWKSFPPPGKHRAWHTSTFQHGNPGAAITEVQPSPGGVEPELRLLLLGAGWTGPQGHFHVSLWAQTGARQAPLMHVMEEGRGSPQDTQKAEHPIGHQGTQHPDPKPDGCLLAPRRLLAPTV